MGEFRETEKIISAIKIKISKKRWPERRRSWIFDGKTGQLYWSLNRKWPFTVFFKGEMSWKFCQQVLARAWSLLSLLWPKKKYPHRKPVWSQFPLPKVLQTTRYRKCSRWAVQQWTLWQKQLICLEKVHLNFLYYSVLKNNALQRTTSNGVRYFGRWIAYSQGHPTRI